MNAISRRQFAAPALLGAAAVLPARSATSTLTPEMEQGDMIRLTPYLLFDGNCRQAMEFYKFCFGGELTVVTVGGSLMKDRMPLAQQDKILNARLRSGNLDVSASDWLRPDRTRVHGNTVCMYVHGGSLPDLTAVFERLSDGGEVTDPLREEFFGTYGALNDKFGVRWMFQTGRGK